MNCPLALPWRPNTARGLFEKGAWSLTLLLFLLLCTLLCTLLLLLLLLPMLLAFNIEREKIERNTKSSKQTISSCVLSCVCVCKTVWGRREREREDDQGNDGVSCLVVCCRGNKHKQTKSTNYLCLSISLYLLLLVVLVCCFFPFFFSCCFVCLSSSSFPSSLFCFSIELKNYLVIYSKTLQRIVDVRLIQHCRKLRDVVLFNYL